MRALVLSLLLAGAPAGAQTSPAPTISAEIAATGLAATEARLAALTAPAPADSFALGGVRFLRAIERTLQLRWRVGMNSASTELPVLRLPIPPNPSPEPFSAADITRLFEGLRSDMAAARAALAPIGEAGFELKIRLGDLWFDIDANGQRSPGEDVLTVAAGVLTGGRPFAVDNGQPFAEAVVLFDTADAAWLSAYAAFLSGFANLALAFDPESAVAEVVAAHEGIAALQAGAPPANALDSMFGRQADRLMMIWRTLHHQPDPALTAAARADLLAMVAENRRFWTLVAAETDTRNQWVPNDTQTSALGLTLPPGTGARWLAVLTEAEAVLNGEKLVPHWRLGSDAGIDARAWFEAPGPVEPLEWAHGMGVLKWARQGPRMTPGAWLDFERMMQGDAVLFAVFLN